MAKTTYVTEEGLRKLKEELNHLQSVERPAISRQIAEARDKGDLSENAEYDAAKEAQGMLEMRIAKLQDTIHNSRIIDPDKINTSSVQILNIVKIKNLANKATMQYQIVAESEADLKAGKISIDTPIAKGLLGKKVGDVVEVEVPNGKMKFEILEISM
jgi:transcription elongation factor GreA